MKGYAIFTEKVNNQSLYDEYINGVMPTIEKSGGKIIIVQDNPVVLEGQWPGDRTVVIEFESPEAASNWYNSPDYQAIIGKRKASTDTNCILANEFV